uniref:Xylulose kinase-1 n=1 Tax=Tanacetum cinerariifolium TaxID=118510 RepID=A0A6L2JJQ3_TANCI|nr:hypothetical protein [Tanacetum cinerariifolium]
MTLTFAETHNMVAYLSKSNASEGFHQILDFLNGSSIKYALIVNLNIYVSCIKQFWITVAVKKVNDVIRLQALVDKKKVVVTEATIREVLHLDDAEDVECLPNEEIFTENQVGDLSTHTTKYTSPALTQKVFANMRRVGKGFSGVETPLFEGMLVEQQVAEEGDAKVHGEEVNTGDAAEGDVSAANDEVPTVTEEPSIPSPTPLTSPLQPSHDIPSTSYRVKPSDDTVMDDVSNQGRMIAETDQNAYVVLEDDKEVADDAKADQEEAKVDEILAVTLTAAPARVTAAPSRRRKGVVIKDPQEESTTSTIIPAETKYKDKGKGILVEEPKPLKKQQQIKQDEKYARELEAELNKNIDWDKAIDHVKKKAKEDPAVKRYQVLKRKPQTKAQARKNMIIYLKNVAGFKMDYFKGMSYDDIRPIFEANFNTNVDFLQKIKEQIKEEESRVLKRLNETLAKKAAKRQKLDEEVEELKRHL